MKILKDIGLSKTEIAIYERLLELGECPVGVLKKSLEMHPQIIYRAIEGLSKKGLVLVINKKNKKYVSAEHPKKLEELEKDKLAKLKEAMPELLQLMKTPKETIVKTSIGFEAVRAFRRLAISELKRNDSLLIIGGSGDRFYDALGLGYKEIEEKRIKKKIHKKLIAFPTEREKFKKDPFKLYTEYKYFSSYQPTTSSVNIFGDHVGIIVWAIEPILLHIKNAEIATSYKHYFDELWQSASY